LAAAALTLAVADRARAQPWSTRAATLEAIQEVAVAALGGKLYLVGGLVGAVPSDRVEVWDPVSDSWSFVSPLPAPLHHTTATALGGKLYVIGGWSDFFATPLASVYEYDPTTDSWASRSAMPTARGSPAAAAVGSEIYVAGGDPGGSDFAVYDPATDTWQPLPPMPTARQHLGAAGVGGRFYAVGGRSSLGAGQNNVDANEVFDPATGVWTSLAPLPRARSGLAVAAAGRFVLAFGGEGNTESPDGTFPDADAYDTVLATWTTLSPMPTPRHGIGAANLGGRIHIPAGGPVEGFGLTDVHEVYDPNVELPTASPLPATSPLALFALTLGCCIAASCWLGVPREPATRPPSRRRRSARCR
jgi:N-acetylneuraminic acid mutarotase